MGAIVLVCMFLYSVLSFGFIFLVNWLFSGNRFCVWLSIALVVILPVWDIILGRIAYYAICPFMPKPFIEKTVEAEGFSYSGVHDCIFKNEQYAYNDYGSEMNVDGIYFDSIKNHYMYIEAQVNRECIGNYPYSNQTKDIDPSVYRCVPMTPRGSNNYTPTYCCPVPDMLSEYVVEVRTISAKWLGRVEIHFKKIIERSSGKTIAEFNQVSSWTRFPFFSWLEWGDVGGSGVSYPTGNWYQFEYEVLKARTVTEGQMQDYYLKAQEYCQVVNESNIKIEQGLLTLHGLEPPSDLADDAEIILVSGYEPSNPDSVKVVLDRPGKKILLILNSVEPITWHVEAKPTTKIAGILISPYKKSTVYTNTPTKAYASGLGIVLKLSDPGFTSLLTMLNGWFGVNKVDVFKGAYSLPPMISISEPDPSNFLLTLSGPPTQRPPTDFEFNLYTKDYKPVRWKLTKPLEDTKKLVFTKSKFALSSDGNTLYLLNGDIIIIKDRRTGAQRRIPLPVGFPEISWASDLAYDTSRNILSLISFGGEGFFYRFDTKNEKWIDYYSMKNIDVKALAYDSGLDKYLAWANPGLLLFLSPDGQLLSKHKLTEILPGFKRLASDYEVPILRVIPNAKNIGMVAFDHNDSVKYIWYYSVDSQKALLTYKSQ